MKRVILRLNRKACRAGQPAWKLPTLMSQTWTCRTIGALGFVFPVVVVISGFIIYGSVKDSLSDYYGSGSRDVFVIMMLLVAWFLIRYRGYDIMDNLAGKLAGTFALGVVFFPNNSGDWREVVHFVSATGLFLMFSFFCLFIFTKTEKSRPNHLRQTLASFRFCTIKSNIPEMRLKMRRNKIYVTCGLVILLGIVLVPIYNLFLQQTVISVVKPTLSLEWLMIWAFGLAGLVKGETIWSDRRIPVEPYRLSMK